MKKTELFENTNPAKALAVMAAPTVASQLVVLIYNLADTWFIGRTNDPYMIAASSLALTVYLATVALSNVFGVGGGSLMARLSGEKRMEEAKAVVSYSVSMCALSALIFSILVLIFMDPLLKMLGASENTLTYARQYVFTTTVIGGVPTALSMCMSQLLRNSGYAKEAGIGVGIGSLLNIILDPIFMFLLLPKGQEVLGAGVATMLSNVCSLFYFVIKFKLLRNETVLVLPRRIERIGTGLMKGLYSVGIPSAFAIFLFDLVTIVINRLTASYGDIPLAAMGIVLKLERIPINTGLGICLGMVPLVAYNYGAGNQARMKRISSLARIAVVILSCICTGVFWIFAKDAVALFMADESTILQGAVFLRGRCLSLPFMMIGYHVVNYMNAVGEGKVSFLLALLRHVVLIIPITLFLNYAFGMDGLIWSQLVADFLNSILSICFLAGVTRRQGIANDRKAG